MEINSIINNFYNEKSISLSKLNLNFNIGYNIFGFHLLLNLLEYEGDIPESVSIVKDSKEENANVNFKLEAPHGEPAIEFYKKLETLVENYNDHHSESLLEIYFDENDSKNTAPSFPQIELTNIPYLSIKPFLSEQLLKKTIKDKEKFITKPIIHNNLEKLKEKKTNIIKKYLDNKNKLQFAYPYCEPRKLTALFFEHLTEDEQKFLEPSLYKDSSGETSQKPTEAIISLEDLNLLLSKNFFPSMKFSYSQKLLNKLTKNAEFYFKLHWLEFIDNICYSVKQEESSAKFAVRNSKLESHLKEYNKEIAQLSVWGIIPELLEKGALNPKHYVKLILAVKELTGEPCVDERLHQLKHCIKTENWQELKETVTFLLSLSSVNYAKLIFKLYNDVKSKASNKLINVIDEALSSIVAVMPENKDKYTAQERYQAGLFKTEIKPPQDPNQLNEGTFSLAFKANDPSWSYLLEKYMDISLDKSIHQDDNYASTAILICAKEHKVSNEKNKALEEKIRQLQEENEQLKTKICELEEKKLQGQEGDLAQSRPTFYR